MERLPFDSLRFCCTGLLSEERRETDSKITKLGGTHYSDLMSDVKILIVGNRDTAKYKFCVKKRPDVIFIDKSAIDKIYSKWLAGEDSKTLNIKDYKLPIFDKINICLSRVDILWKNLLNNTRKELLVKSNSSTLSDFFDLQNLHKIITLNGGKSSEGLTQASDCIITAIPSGKRYTRAKDWNKAIVHPIWLFDSIVRGAALDFDDYLLNINKIDYTYPYGCDIWDDIINGDNSQDIGKPFDTSSILASIKDKKSDASKCLRTDSSIWNSIMDKPVNTKKQKTHDSWNEEEKEEQEKEEEEEQEGKKNEPAVEKDKINLGLFHQLNFLLIGFTSKQMNLLSKAIESSKGKVTDTSSETITHIILPSNSGSNSSSMLKVLPANLKSKITNGKIFIRTEWWIERSMYYQCIKDDSWGNPIKGLVSVNSPKKFKICLSGFTGIELLHMEKLLQYLDLEYCSILKSNRDLLVINIQLFKDKLGKEKRELFKYEPKDILQCETNNQVSLISTSNKVTACKKWLIPIVSIAYLWECMKLSENQSQFVWADISNREWCMFNPSKATDLIKYIDNNNELSSNPNQSSSPRKLPSPRRVSPKKYGRIEGTSKQRMISTESKIVNEETTMDEISCTQISYQEQGHDILEDKPDKLPLRRSSRKPLNS